MVLLQLSLVSHIVVKKANISLGIMYMMIATASFSLMNICIKYLSHLPVVEIVFLRCLIALIIVFGVMHKNVVKWTGGNKKLLLLRGGFGTLALFTFFITLQKLPLGTAVTIQYTSPIFTTLLATIFFKERVPYIQYIFFAISFSGVALLKGVDTQLSSEYLGIGLLSAMFSGFAYNFVRTLKAKEHPLVVVLHFQIIGAIFGGIFSVFNWHTPSFTDAIFIVGTGVFTYFGQYYLTLALQSEKVGVVSSVNYLGVVYALIFGVLLFGEKVDYFNLISIFLVLFGVILSIIFKEKSKVEERVS